MNLSRALAILDERRTDAERSFDRSAAHAINEASREIRERAQEEENNSADVIGCLRDAGLDDLADMSAQDIALRAHLGEHVVKLMKRPMEVERDIETGATRATIGEAAISHDRIQTAARSLGLLGEEGGS